MKSNGQSVNYYEYRSHYSLFNQQKTIIQEALTLEFTLVTPLTDFYCILQNSYGVFTVYGSDYGRNQP